MMRRQKVFCWLGQETWGSGKRQWENNGITLLYNGLAVETCRRGAQGVVIALEPEAKKCWEKAGSQMLCFGPRIIATRLAVEDPAGRPFTMFLVDGYAPDSGQLIEEVLQYQNDLRCCLDAMGPNERLVMRTDANASLGVRNANDGPYAWNRDRVLGPHGVPRVNDQGRVLHELLAANQLCAPTTFFDRTPKGGHEFAHDTYTRPARRPTSLTTSSCTRRTSRWCATQGRATGGWTATTEPS